jgi:hypothetical protein
MTRSRVNADNSQSNARSFPSTTEPTGIADGTIWVDTDGITAAVQRLRWKKAPAGGTAALTGLNDEGNQTLVYTVNYEEVFLNGILLVRGVDYAATDGSTVTLSEATVAGDIVEIFTTPNLAVTDVYTTAQADAKYLPKSLVDAKGDLYVATADNTTVRLPVGGNDQVLVADSAAASGVAWKSNAGQQAAGKNLVINGGFDYWQRNTTFNAIANEGYLADRWFIVNDAVGTCNISRVDIASANSGIGARYALRSERSAGTNRWVIITLVPGALDYVGDTVTFSGYLRKGPALTSDVFVTAGTRVGRYGTQYDGASVNVPASSMSTTAFTRFSVSFTIGASTASAGADFFEIELSATQAGATGAYYELTGVQLEVGATATPFSRTGGSLAGELRECQRYYYRATPGTTAYGLINHFGIATSSTIVMSTLNLPVTMRINPFSVDFSTLRVFGQTTGNYNAVTNVTIDTGATGSTTPQSAMLLLTSTSLTTNSIYGFGTNNSTSGYVGVSAEFF